MIRWCGIRSRIFSEAMSIVPSAHGDRADDADAAVARVVALDLAGQLDEVDVAVRRDGDLHRVLGRVVERDLVERGVGRQALARLAAVAGLLTRRPLDRAVDLLAVVQLL